ncbi:MAG: MATE family efflux transporter [Planctomycetes bacterium]|nr:MATE family efflux transporter [Planctomycetota bacterium]
MTSTTSIEPRGEWRAVWALSWPAIVAQIGQMLLGVVDTAMLGNYSAESMAGTQLGHNWVMPFAIVAMGVLLGMDPIVSQAHGARNGVRCARALQHGLVLCVPLTLALVAVVLVTEPMLLAMGQSAKLAPVAADYTLALLPGMPLFLVFAALRSYLQGRGITHPVLWISVGANLLNAFCNWLLIYGNWGLPELGATGAGISTSITRLAMVVALLVWIRAQRLHEGAWLPWSRAALERRGVGEVLHHGVPTGLQLGLEVWAFAGAAFLAGRIGTGELEVAAYGTVLNMASLSFMFPLGVAIGTSTRVGNLIGANDRPAAQRASWIGFKLGGALMLAWALAFIVLRAELPKIYWREAAVIALCASTLPIAAAFQVFDGLQAVGSGILRGMGRTRPAALINLFAYYGVALPIAWWLGLHTQLGLHGVWTGLAIGLAVAALLYIEYVRRAGPDRDVAPALGSACGVETLD